MRRFFVGVAFMRTGFGGTLSHKRGLVAGVSAIALSAVLLAAGSQSALAEACVTSTTPVLNGAPINTSFAGGHDHGGETGLEALTATAGLVPIGGAVDLDGADGDT